MLKFGMYIIRREYKWFLGALTINIALVLGVRWGLIPEQFGPWDSSMILGFYIFVMTLSLLERLSGYIEKGLIYNNREFYLSIPVPVHSMLNVIGLMIVLEYAVWYGIMNFFMKNTWVFVWRDTLMILLFMIAFTYLINYLMSLIETFFKSRVSGTVIFAAVVLTISIVISIVINVFKIDIPYLYDFRIGLVSLCLLLAAVSYHGLCRKFDVGEGKRFYRTAALILILSSFLIYGVGQTNVYANRRVDEISKAFEMDEEAIGEWALVGIDTEAMSMDQMDLDDYGDYHIAMNEFYRLKLQDGGGSNHGFYWTKGEIINPDLEVSQKYVVRSHNDRKYLVVEWKNNGYVFRHEDPIYHVYVHSESN